MTRISGRSCRDCVALRALAFGLCASGAGCISRQDALRVFRSAAPAVHERVVDEVRPWQAPSRRPLACAPRPLVP